METLPEEVKLHILDSLLTATPDVASFSAICQSNREYYRLCQDESLWKRLYQAIDPSAKSPPYGTWKNSVLNSDLVSVGQLRQGIDLLEQHIIDFLNYEREGKPRIPPYRHQMNKEAILQNVEHLLTEPQIVRRYGRFYIIGDPSTFRLDMDHTLDAIVKNTGVDLNEYYLYKERGAEYWRLIEKTIQQIIDPHHILEYVDETSDGWPLPEDERYFRLTESEI